MSIDWGKQAREQFNELIPDQKTRFELKHMFQKHCEGLKVDPENAAMLLYSIAAGYAKMRNSGKTHRQAMGFAEKRAISHLETMGDYVPYKSNPAYSVRLTKGEWAVVRSLSRKYAWAEGLYDHHSEDEEDAAGGHTLWFRESAAWEVYDMCSKAGEIDSGFPGASDSLAAKVAKFLLAVV